MTSGREVRARGVQRGRVAGRAAADDDHVLDVRHRITLAFRAHFTLYSSSPPPIVTPARRPPSPPGARRATGHAPAQLEVGDRARAASAARTRTRGRSARRRSRSPTTTPKRREGADHAAVDPADAARQRQHVAEHARRSRPARSPRRAADRARRRGSTPTAWRCRSPTRRPRPSTPHSRSRTRPIAVRTPAAAEAGIVDDPGHDARARGPSRRPTASMRRSASPGSSDMARKIAISSRREDRRARP